MYAVYLNQRYCDRFHMQISDSSATSTRKQSNSVLLSSVNCKQSTTLEKRINYKTNYCEHLKPLLQLQEDQQHNTNNEERQ